MYDTYLFTEMIFIAANEYKKIADLLLYGLVGVGFLVVTECEDFGGRGLKAGMGWDGIHDD